MDRNGGEHVVESNKDQYTPQEANDKKSKNGSYLEVLALSVTIFFLATICLTNGQIFSDFSSKYIISGAKLHFTNLSMQRVFCNKILTGRFHQLCFECESKRKIFMLAGILQYKTVNLSLLPTQKF
jgi:hypothetical protein